MLLLNFKYSAFNCAFAKKKSASVRFSFGSLSFFYRYWLRTVNIQLPARARKTRNCSVREVAAKKEFMRVINDIEMQKLKPLKELLREI